MEIDLLIVEDRVDESINARLAAARAGFSSYKAVASADEALEAIAQGPKYVLTDLFLPAGSNREQYAQELLPHYESFGESRFPLLGEDTPVRQAVLQCAKVFGVAPEVYVNDWMSAMSTPPLVLQMAQDAVAQRTDSARYARFQQFVAQVRTGEQLPSGIYVARAAQAAGIPCVVVTSTNHHDDAFEAVRSLVTVPYVDNLVDGKKDWDAGIATLRR
jgi:CheY-like chemotaxis protein